MRFRIARDSKIKPPASHLDSCKRFAERRERSGIRQNSQLQDFWRNPLRGRAPIMWWFYLVICSILVLSHSVSVLGHEQFLDGDIERGVQVSVKPDCVLVQYSIAMNRVTLQDRLEKHQQKPAETLVGMWKQYQDIALSSLHKNMVLTIDGTPCALKPISGEYFGWKHRHLMCLYQAEIQLTQKAKAIVLTDGNFLDTTGEYRIAMKSRSGAKMRKATVATVVSRAQPVIWGELNKQQKRTAARAEGEFVTRDRRVGNSGLRNR